MSVDEKSPYLELPLPQEANRLDQDLPRLRAAFSTLDSHAQKSDAALLALNAELESKSCALEAQDEALRGTLESTAAELVAHFEAENPHHIPAADRVAAGLVRVGEGIEVEQGVISVPPAPQKYDLCEFYFFRHPTLRPGFQPAQGGLLENAATLYPEAWSYLQTPEGQMLCTTEAEWQAMTTAVWATLADGTRVGWNGIGGAPYYAPNTATGALRLPDLRGMYAEAAGFDALGVGGVHGDAVREIWGDMGSAIDFTPPANPGALITDTPGIVRNGLALAVTTTSLRIRVSRIVPTAAKNQPRAFGVLACVYLGAPR